MPLIATSVEAGGIARIFFDMRAVPVHADEIRIAKAIERASASVATEKEATEQLHAA